MLRVILICKSSGVGVKKFCDSLAQALNHYKHIKARVLAVNSITNLLSSLKALSNKREKIILHANYATLALISSKVLGFPILYTSHGIPQPFLENTSLSRLSYRAELRSINLLKKCPVRLITVSKYVSSMLSKYFRLKPDKTIYNGVDHNFFYPPHDKTSVKRNIGLITDRVILLNVGRLNNYKNQKILLNSIFHLDKSLCKKILLVFIGRGPLERDLRKMAKLVEKAKNVKIIFLQNLSEDSIRLIYQSADLYIHTTINEMFGLSLVEAMSSGLPVIASTGGAVKEILGVKYDFYFEPYDHEKLSSLIELLINNPDLREQCSRHCYVRSLNFDWRKTAYEYLKEYMRILDFKC